MSTKTHPDDPRTSLPPSVVILGNDAQLAARPATPVQLAHACLAAGYRAVVPASWGDELIAAATMRALASQQVRPAIQCVCPHVARRVLAVGSDLSPYLISLVSPPVAAARYVRRHSPGGVRVTYVGRCPGAGDESIDARLTPEELLAQLTERGIQLATQPLVFESVIPPDRRRHRSQPGGLPSPESLWNGERPTTVEIVSEDDLVSEIAEKVLAATNSLLDLAPSVGCVCAGAVAHAAPHRARTEVVALEPPRALAPVVNEEFAVGLELLLPAAARSPLDIIAPPEAEGAMPVARTSILPAAETNMDLVTSESTPSRRPRFTPPENEAPGVVAPRRRPNAGGNRVIPGSMPVASDSEGRVLPRAYVARRRSPRGGIPAITDAPTPQSASAPAAAPPVIAPQTSQSVEREPQRAAPPAPREQARVEPRPDLSTSPRVEPQAVARTDTGAPRHTVRLPAGDPPRGMSAPAPAHPEANRRETHEAQVHAPVPVAGVGFATVESSFAPSAPAPIIHTPRPLDAELPIAQSREPAGIANGKRKVLVVPALPMLVDQVRRTSERVSGGVRALALRSPRTALVVALAAFVLLGVALGYAAARGAANRTARDAGEQTAEPRTPSSVPGVVPGAPRDSGRSAGGGVAGRRSPARPPRRSTVRPAAPAATPDSPVNPGSASAAALPAADSSAAASRDSAARAAARVAAKARADSLAAEREALRLELEQRRARLDSIARRVQQIKPGQR